MTVERVACCVWPATAAVVVAVDDRFGQPLDAYVNGSQVWLRDDGPAGATLEWRLHPVGGYRRPEGVGTYDVFPTVALAVATGATPPAPLESLWEGLEAFAAHGDDLEVAALVSAAAESLGIPPRWSGHVDHERVADEWQRSGRRSSIVAGLIAQLEPPGAG